MARPLVIVESPAKAKTIGRFLGNGYMVEASIGHVRDLPKSAAEVPDAHRGDAWARTGVDIKNDFKPLYVVSDKKKEQVSRLKALLKDASELYLATDEDREGESISWHLLEVLKPKVPVKRLVFHEITDSAIKKAMAHPRSVDQNLVKAQETRRIVDRLYGYEVSPLLWKKVRPKLSAGRVQSVAVRLLVQRERARMAFHSAVWWDLEAQFDVEKGRFSATLVEMDGKKLATGKDFDESTGKLAKSDLCLMDEAAAKDLHARVQGRAGRISKVEARPYKERPAPPFTTSTVQQEANRKLKWTARRTMQVAQKLYENGWITYMRTDSVSLSDQAIHAARELILNNYGSEYLPAVARTYKNTAKNAQEAHEAIRPAGERFKTIEEARSELEADEARLYELIWKRTVACQMEDATGKHLSVGVELVVPRLVNKPEVKTQWLATGKTIEFPGYRRAYVEGSDDPDAELADQERLLPSVKVDEASKAQKVDARSHTTQAPARLTEATLVKELESRGIGRPSTYASIIETILEREYVVKRGNALVPTFTAFAVINLMEKALPGLVDYGFTARMEDELDEIALGKKDRLATLQSFYDGENGIKPQLGAATDSVDPREVCTIVIGKHEEQDVTVRVGRFGPFLAAGDATAPIPDDVAPDEVTVAWAWEQFLKKADGPRSLGNHPDGTAVYLMNGRFGAYVQKGEAKGDEKPPRATLLEGMTPDTIDLGTALRLLSLPRTLGKDAAGNDVIATNGRYGPYVKRNTESRSILQGQSILDITLEEALVLFDMPARRTQAKAAALKEIPTADGKVLKVLSGRFGPYVSDGTTNASLPKGIAPENLTLDEALELLERRRAAAGDAPVKAKKAPSPLTKRVVKAASAEEAEAPAAPKRNRKPKATEAVTEAKAEAVVVDAPVATPKAKAAPKAKAPKAEAETVAAPKAVAPAKAKTEAPAKAEAPKAKTKAKAKTPKAPEKPAPKPPPQNTMVTIKARSPAVVEREARAQAASAVPANAARRRG